MIKTIKKMFEQGTDDKRTQYRKPATVPPKVRASVVLGRNSLERVALMNTSAGGLLFRCAPNSELAYELGDELPMRISAHGDPHETELTLVVVRLEGNDEQTEYACSFKEPFLFYKEASQRLWKIFNRRKTFRVEPPSNTPPRVRITVNGRAWDGDLVDISAGGLAAQFESALPIESKQRVQLELDFLEEFVPQHLLWVEVRHIREHARGTTIGVQFSDETPREARDAVREYVADQQLRVMRTKLDL